MTSWRIAVLKDGIHSWICPHWSGSAPTFNGFFLGSWPTHPTSFLKIGHVFFLLILPRDKLQWRHLLLTGSKTLQLRVRLRLCSQLVASPWFLASSRRNHHCPPMNETSAEAISRLIESPINKLATVLLTIFCHYIDQRIKCGYNNQINQ